MSNIRIGLVEDDPDWLRGIADFLKGESDFNLVWTASTGEELREALSHSDGNVDVVLMDIMIQGKPEGVLLAEETALATGARIIMLTSMEEKELILKSFQAGAIDYQLKSNFEQIPDAVRAAYSKQSPISATAAEQLREEFRRLRAMERDFEAKKMGDLITPSELQLLSLIDQGYSQPQIAEKQFITLRTVKNHVNHILKKLGMEGSKEAASKLKEMGLLDKENKGR
ncbi:response regulator transcription factor [Paenibacillus sp. GSMTC-2017]|uniref:response regulator n=1 Tax=Paenibacillus sp. GSMTC-2017 TaxID=2794350 RepID=UPI0018D8D61D|nr:response regulator transcription factor [Paenibacillus sp. GSMTC-2017]MBH5316938.1 response regulator transcription factor [Paenibacillus sp. GSMTC-2017]